MKNLNQFQILERYIKGIASGYAHSLVILGKAGTGKTEGVITDLEQLGLKEGQEYLYLNGHITALQLYKELQRANELNEPNLLVIDDCEQLLKDMRAVGILKGALWALPNGTRKVSWFSSTWKIDTKSFDFKGKIIFLINSATQENPIVRAFIDRGLFYKMSFTNQELIALMKERAKKPYHGLSPKQKSNVVNFIERVGLSSENLSLRLLEKSFRLYLLSPNHWQILLLKSMNIGSK